MKKSVALAFLLVLLVACGGVRKGETPQPVDFRSGSQGLQMQFVQNLPPPRLFDRDSLNVMIEVENRGTSPVGDANDFIYLSGFDNTIITGVSQYGVPIPGLEPRGPFLPQGGRDAVNFKGVIQSLSGKRIDKYQPTVLATACYDYETIASAQVCVDPNPYAATSVQKVCTPASVGTGSQGAPIAVTRVDVEPSPGKTRFRINIANVGGGDVFKLSAMQHCSPYDVGLAFDEIDFIRVEEVSVSGVAITPSCKPIDREGNVRLTGGQATLYCEFTNMQGQSAYLTPLNIELKYGYRQSIARQIEIRPIS